MPCVVTLPKANIRLLVIFKILIEMRWWGAESGGVIFAPLESQGVERNIDSWERSFITCFGFLNFKTFPQISWLLTLMTAWCKSLYLDCGSDYKKLRMWSNCIEENTHACTGPPCVFFPKFLWIYTYFKTKSFFKRPNLSLSGIFPPSQWAIQNSRISTTEKNLHEDKNRS